MKKIVVNADDFGRSAPINQGIIEAHQKGIVSSASLMTDREGFQEAVALARQNPRLGIGLHLDLDSFFEVQHGVGRLLRYKDASLPLSAIAQETERQIQKILSTGLPIHHLDGHHHAHLRPELFAMVAALTVKYKIKFIRYFKGFFDGLYPGVPVDWILPFVHQLNLKTTGIFFAGWEPVESSLPGYSYFNPAAEFSTAELMVHPGKGELWREKELAHCISSHTLTFLKKYEIQVVPFAELN